MKRFAIMRAAALAMLAALAATGAASAQTTPPNVMGTTVWVGPYGTYLNGPFATVKVCRAGTLTCQKVSGLLVDTGSFGLRIFKQALSVPLDSETSGADVIAECTPFGSLTTWGRVAFADVRMGGEPKIVKLPIQIINPNWPPVPASCTSTGTPLARSPRQLGFNGILGVGLLPDDHGFGIYFPCTGAGCGQAITVDPSAAVQNPVAHLPTDNNGVILKFPALPSYGAPSVGGKLIFGIDTETNNHLGTAKIYQTDSHLDIMTTYKGGTLPGFLDSGSNGLFFSSAIPRCGTSRFYCPANLVALKVTNTGYNSVSGSPTIYIANTIALLNTGNDAFADLGAAFGGFFDFGMPFFFGRRVYVGMGGGSPSPTGGAPYWAY